MFAGSTARPCTSSTRRGIYLRWLQFPIRIVMFLFSAVPIGKVRDASGYTPTIERVPAFAKASVTDVFSS